MKLKLHVAVIVASYLVVLAVGGLAGYAYRGELNLVEAHREFVDGQRDVTRYVEECTVQRAHAGECSIPCANDADCQAKNGTRDSY